MVDYDKLTELLKRIEQELKAIGCWQDTMPDRIKGGPEGAFGMQNMTPEEWLQFAFLPNARARIAEKDIPSESNVGIMAIRNFDGSDRHAALTSLLCEFDDEIEGDR